MVYKVENSFNPLSTDLFTKKEETSKGMAVRISSKNEIYPIGYVVLKKMFQRKENNHYMPIGGNISIQL